MFSEPYSTLKHALPTIIRFPSQSYPRLNLFTIPYIFKLLTWFTLNQ